MIMPVILGEDLKLLHYAVTEILSGILQCLLQIGN